MTIIKTNTLTGRFEPVFVLKKVMRVTGWELKHFGTGQPNWALALAAFCFFIGLLGVRNQWGYILGTSAVGQLAELVYNLMLIFGLMLPFLVTDQVAHDYQERTHELLMTTAIPTCIYVLGRYLAVLLIGLGLTTSLLVAQLLVNIALPVIYPQFPPADPLITLSLWVRLTIPAGMLVGSLCFCLGTLFPRLTVIPKLAVCIAWIILALDNDPTDLTWRAYWNPTGAGMITQAFARFEGLVTHGLKSTPGSLEQAELVLRLQQNLPNLYPWLLPFVTLALIGLLLGFLTMIGFQRFRNVMNG